MSHFNFTVKSKWGKSRLGQLLTPHGEIETPVFMPVGTQATVKAVLPQSVWDAGARIVLSNAYHLHLRPGAHLVEEAGGLHAFMNWPGACLTDSGGFQVMSLGRDARVDDGGVSFRSHIDGSHVRFTPEESIKTQVSLGADIIMCFDQCIGYPCSRDAAKDAMERTLLWAKRASECDVPDKQMLFGIVQGSTFTDLREQCAERLQDIGFLGYAVGGLSVGEPKDVFFKALESTVDVLPPEKPRYLMGVGHPIDLVRGSFMGVDMFDCVLPTRNARHGRAFTFTGPKNLRNARYIRDFSPIEDGCDCVACQGFSKAYVRHLIAAQEKLAWTLVSLHNIRFFARLMEKVRSAIRLGPEAERELLGEMETYYPYA